MKYHPIYSCFANALRQSELDLTKVCVISDFLHQPDISEYLGVDTFHIHRGRSIAFGTGLKLGNPEVKVIALIGDLITLGGNHFMHASRRNMDLTVICVNNFVYPKVANQITPHVEIPFSQYATFEKPPNVPHVARSCGAVYIARWTAKHVPELTGSMTAAIKSSGFTTIEVIAPGIGYFPGTDDIENNAEVLDFFYKNSEQKDDENTSNIEIQPDKKIIVGKFAESSRPTFMDSYNKRLEKVLGDKFKPYR